MESSHYSSNRILDEKIRTLKEDDDNDDDDDDDDDDDGMQYTTLRLLYLSVKTEVCMTMVLTSITDRAFINSKSLWFFRRQVFSS